MSVCRLHLCIKLVFVNVLLICLCASSSPSLFAVELAMIMDRLYGGVCYAGIDTDPELKYPKGAGRVAFSNQQSYIAAISARFVQLQHGEIDKRVSGKRKKEKSSVFFCLPSRPPPFFSLLPALTRGVSFSCAKVMQSFNSFSWSNIVILYCILYRNHLAYEQKSINDCC